MLLKGVAYCHTHSIMHRVRPHTDVAALYSIHVCAPHHLEHCAVSEAM